MSIDDHGNTTHEDTSVEMTEISADRIDGFAGKKENLKCGNF